MGRDTEKGCIRDDPGRPPILGPIPVNLKE
jgi:hypothetical protein